MIKPVHRTFYGILKVFLLAGMLLLWLPGQSSENPFPLSWQNDGEKARVSRFYPNPATSVIHFEFASDIDKTYSLQVYNFTGKKVYEAPVSNSKLTVNLTDFFRGLYFFQLRDRTGRIVETGKFQVIR